MRRTALRVATRTRMVLVALASFITITGIVTFTLFIMEESLQTTMFGTWSAQDAKDYVLVIEGTDIMEDINATMKGVNRWAGWIHPLAFMSYRSYGRASDYYILSLKTKIFAMAPELFEGRTVTFHFKPDYTVNQDGRIIMFSEKIRVTTDRWPETIPVKVTGKVTVVSGKIWVDMEDTK